MAYSGTWHHEKFRQDKLDLIKKQKKAGTLLVRKATKDERETGVVNFRLGAPK